VNGSLISNSIAIGESILCLVAFLYILYRKQTREYRVLCILLGFRGGYGAVLVPLYMFGGYVIERHLAYRIYFYAFWAGFAIESILGLLLIYSVFNLAMAPLNGLKKLGRLVFLWAAGISVAIALGSAITPHVTQMSFIVDFVSELQRTQSILTLCLLLFVCFAIRPMGLSFSSRIFGVSLGLGLQATTDLVSSAWTAHFQGMYTTMNMVVGIASCCVVLLWVVYFAVPEPKRRIIVLPTTSPFLRWNQISQVLGDDPGYVAVGGIPPELFAPAELEVMRRASLKMAQQPMSAISRPQSA
jgi:hypothetical protein